jgi:hypothetical protein
MWLEFVTRFQKVDTQGMASRAAAWYVMLDTPTGYVVVPQNPEETVRKLEAKHGGRFYGWFSSQESARTELNRLERKGKQ